MKQIKIFLLLILIFLPFSAQAADYGDPILANVATASSDVSGYSIQDVAVDNSGNYYAAGYMDTNDDKNIFLNFGTVSVTGANKNNCMFLVKFDTNGNPVWGKGNATTTATKIQSITTDSNGNVYIAGYFFSNGSCDLGNGVTFTGHAYDYYNFFVAKYDSNGNAIWAKTAVSGSDVDSYLTDVTVDSNGNVYVAGYIQSVGTLDLDNGVTATSISSSSNLVLIKYDSSGNTMWAKTLSGSTGASYPYSIALDNFDDPYVGGKLTGTTAFDFGNNITVSPAYTDTNIFVAKYNSTGNPQWAKSTTSAPSDSTIKALTLDNDGNLLAAGHLDNSGTYQFGDGVKASPTYSGVNSLLLKYNSTGHAKWATIPTSNPGDSMFQGVATTPNGEILTAGYITGTGQYDFNNNITASGVDAGSNLVLVNYDNNGKAILAKNPVNGTSHSAFYKVAVNNPINSNNSDIYAAGYINNINPFNLGNSIIVNGTELGENGIIVKYHGNYTDPESSSKPSSSSSSSKQPIASSSSSSNPAVVSDASTILLRLPKLLAIAGGVLLLF